MKVKWNWLKYVFLFVLIVAVGIQFIYILSSELTFSLIQKMIMIGIQIISIIGYTHFHLIDKDEKMRKKGIVLAHRIVFIVYFLNLLYILFLDPDFGRYMFQDMSSFEDYLRFNVNLKPFESIMLFVNGYQREAVSLEALLRNIGGNMIVFMPMAYFLPFFFKSQRKWYWFTLTIIFIVFVVEVLQVLLRLGSGDVDDLLLNVFGALFMYIVLKCFAFRYSEES